MREAGQPMLARTLADTCTATHHAAGHDLLAPGSAVARLACAWHGSVLPANAEPEGSAEALAEALTFGALAEALGLPVPWLAEAPGALLEPIRAALASLHLGDAATDALYEGFLRAAQPHRRLAHGVFSTPAPLVRAQVRLLANLLEGAFGCRLGFGDPRVGLLDPAAGQGAYALAAIADAVARGARPATLANRIEAFEPLVGAAVLARARLSAALGGAAVRVQVADALEAPGSSLGTPILACLGNPPYRRGPARPASAPREFLDGEPAAGVHRKNVYNAYVEFWAWAVRSVLERRPGPGIISFVTPASFLVGPGFGGMRAALRRAFDELWVLDLGGDQRGGRPTDNVFPVRLPVAVALGVRYGRPGPTVPARVWYTRLGGSRQAKLAVLDSLRTLGDLPWAAVAGSDEHRDGRAWPAVLVPRPRSAYHEWPRLVDLFPLQLSGCQLKRTWPIGPTPDVLRQRWARLLALDGQARQRAFRPTRDRDLHSRPADLLDPRLRRLALAELAAGTVCPEPLPYAYRSFDRQWVLPDARLGDFMRPRLWRLAGPQQVFLTSWLTGILGPGPAAVATALVPDLDHFRGSFGGRAVIPLWLDTQASQPNVAVKRLDDLQQRLGLAVAPADLFAACYALLGGPTYVARFQAELAEPGPRVPLPGRAADFLQAVELGRRLVWLHTFGARWSDGQPPLQGRARWERPPSRPPQRATYVAASHELQIGDGCIAPVDPRVWSFGVSGLLVLRSWLRYRLGGPKRAGSPLDDIRPRWTPAMAAELLEVVWTLEATLDCYPALDTLLDDVVDNVVSESARGFGARLAG